MAGEEPPFLNVGTEVSAKYRGAFCEAKVKKVVKCVKCKVTLKESQNHIVVSDEDVRGPLKPGFRVEVKHPETGHYVEALVNKVQDSSTYTVVFDDGDENTLRRTQLCLKGEKHFVKSETLDQLPLTHPEHFGTPVMKTKSVKRSSRGGMGESESESESEESEDEEEPQRVYKGRLAEMIGRIVCAEVEDRKKTMWVPMLVVNPNADNLELRTKDHLLCKSFKDSKFCAVTKKESKEFTREMAMKNEDKSVKAAYDKALSYYDTHDLPAGWDKEDLLGVDTEEEQDSDSSDDEPNEEKDLFVAQLYKFMDDRGTPINKGPVIGSRDLSLYKLFRVVQKIGGYNKVTNQMKWRLVYSKMGLPPSAAGSNQIKAAYKKYLHAFEDFYRKLGSSMGTISRPGRNRHNSGRSLLSFREREAPRSPRAEKKSREEKKRDNLEEKDKGKESDEEKIISKEESEPETESPRKGRSRGIISEEKKSKEDEDKKDKDPIVTKPTTRVDSAKMRGPEETVSTRTTPGKSIKQEDQVTTRTNQAKCEPSTRTNLAKCEPVSVKNIPGKTGKSEETIVTRTTNKETVSTRTTPGKVNKPEDVSATKCAPGKAGRQDDSKGVPVKLTRADETKTTPSKSTKQEDTKVLLAKVEKPEQLSSPTGKSAKQEENVVNTRSTPGKGKQDDPMKSTPKGKQEEGAGTPSKSVRGEDKEESKKAKEEVNRKGKVELPGKTVGKSPIRIEEVGKVTRESLAKAKMDDTQGTNKKSKETEEDVRGRRSKTQEMSKDDDGSSSVEGRSKRGKIDAADDKSDEGRGRRNKTDMSVVSKGKDTEDLAKKPRTPRGDQKEEEKKLPRKRSLRAESEKDGPPEPKRPNRTTEPPDKKKTKEGEKSEENSERDEEEEEPVEEKFEPKKTRLREVERYPWGTRLKVKYGRGRNHKIYEAKVVESEIENGALHYLVHYAGWNNRYDEWIQKDRIVSAVEIPDGNLVRKERSGTNSPKFGKSSGPLGSLKKRTIRRPSPTPSSTSSVKSDSSKNKAKSPTPGAVSGKTRASRVYTTDSTPTLPGFRRSRSRRSSGLYEVASEISSHVSESESEEPEESMDEKEEKDEETRTEAKVELTSAKDIKPQVFSQEDESLPTTSNEIPPKEEDENTDSTMDADHLTEKLQEEVLKKAAEQEMSCKESEKVEELTESINTAVKPTEDCGDAESVCKALNEKTGLLEDVKSFDTETETVITEPPVAAPVKVELTKAVEASPQKVVVRTMPSLQDLAKSIGKDSGLITSKKTHNEKQEETETDSVISLEVDESKKKEWDKPKTKRKDTTPKSKKEGKKDNVTQDDSFMLITNETMKEEPRLPIQAEEEQIVKHQSPEKKPKKEKIKTDKKPITEKSSEKLKNKVEKGKKTKLDTTPQETFTESSEMDREKKPESEKKKTKKKVKKKLIEEKEPSVLPSGGSIVNDPYAFDESEKDFIPPLLSMSETFGKTEKSASISPGASASEPPQRVTVYTPIKVPPVSSPHSSPPPPTLTRAIEEAIPTVSPSTAPPMMSPGVPPAVPTTSTQLPAVFPLTSTSTAETSPPQARPPVNKPTAEEHAAMASALHLVALASASDAVSHTLMDNTPPVTPEHSVEHMSPRHDSSEEVSDEDHHRSAVRKLDGADSPAHCDMSTISNSSAGSSGNMPSSESSNEGATSSSSKRKPESEDTPALKKRKRGIKRTNTKDSEANKSSNKPTSQTLSDSDEASMQDTGTHSAEAQLAARTLASVSLATPIKPKQSAVVHTTPAASTPPTAIESSPRTPRPSKYNFNLEEGQHLTGEERISFLLEKIQDIRKIYTGLKMEVAGIDRRRKRAKRKEKEAAMQASQTNTEVECA